MLNCGNAFSEPSFHRRYETQFYVAFLNVAPSFGFSTGDKLERFPTPDGGQEVVSARFMHPQVALSECTARKIMLMTPQFYLVTTLASILDGSVNSLEQRAHVATLSGGPFGRMAIHPRTLHHAAPGWIVSTYAGDETRGGPKGRLHRALIKFIRGGVGSLS